MGPVGHGPKWWLFVYRTPNTNIELFTDEINEIIEPIKNNHNIIIMGDFNICLLQNNNYRSYRNAWREGDVK